MRILFLVICCAVTSSCFAQPPDVVALKKSANTLTGSARADCLIRIGFAYTFDYIHSDSVLRYARWSYNESEKAGYGKGKGLGLILEAERTGRLLGDLDSMLYFLRAAVDKLEKIDEPATLAYAYPLLGLAFTQKGDSANAHLFLNRSLETARRSKDQEAIGWALESIGFSYAKKGDYWNAFQNLVQSQLIGKQLRDSFLTAMSLAFIARCFNHAGDPKTALQYYREMAAFKGKSFLWLWPHLDDIGFAHWQLQQYDSARFYQQLHQRNVAAITSDPKVRQRFLQGQTPSFASAAAFGKKQYDEVLRQQLALYKELRSRGDVLARMHTLQLIARAYEGKQQLTPGLRYARLLKENSERFKNNYFRKEAYNLLAVLHEKLKHPDSAYWYVRQYNNTRELMQEKQFMLKTALYNMTTDAEARISLLKKEKQMQEFELGIKNGELQKQSLLQKFLVTSLLLLLVIGVILFRNLSLKQKNEKLANEQQQAILQKKTIELEMQALRAQMNPHFIFNCLSSIDNLVQSNQSDKATRYLALFARLIRMVLESSKSNQVPFQKDFETMQLYLELEQFRCNNKFTYDIRVDDELLQGHFDVPPLIIQPFIENSIHHGLLNKSANDRRLKIAVSLYDDTIVYDISDNGVGRKQAALIKQMNKPDQRSYGIDITRERIQLHNKAYLPMTWKL